MVNLLVIIRSIDVRTLNTSSISNNVVAIGNDVADDATVMS